MSTRDTMTVLAIINTGLFVLFALACVTEQFRVLPAVLNLILAVVCWCMVVIL